MAYGIYLHVQGPCCSHVILSFIGLVSHIGQRCISVGHVKHGYSAFTSECNLLRLALSCTGAALEIPLENFSDLLNGGFKQYRLNI